MNKNSVKSRIVRYSNHKWKLWSLDKHFKYYILTEFINKFTFKGLSVQSYKMWVKVNH